MQKKTKIFYFAQNYHRLYRNLALTSRKQAGHTETALDLQSPVSFERPENCEIEPVTPRLVHCITALKAI